MRVSKGILALLAVLFAVIGSAAVSRAQSGPLYEGIGQRRYDSLASAACDEVQAATCINRANGATYPAGLVNGMTRRELAVEACKDEFLRRYARAVAQEKRRTLVDVISPADRSTPDQRNACLVAIRHGDFEHAMALMDVRFQMGRSARAAAIASALASASASSAPAPSPSPSATHYRKDPEVEKAAGQLDGLEENVNATLNGPDDNPYVDDAPPAHVYHGTGPTGLGDDLVLLYANDREAAVYVKPGGQFYTIRLSFLAKKYETDWAIVYAYSGNEFRDMFGACFQGRKVTLDQDRMHVKSWDVAKLNGSVNTAFKEQCERDGGEFRFALQAGQVIKIPAKSAGAISATPSTPSASPSTTSSPPAPATPAPAKTWRRQPPSPPVASSAPVAPVPPASVSAPVTPIVPPVPTMTSSSPVVPTAPAASSAPAIASIQPPEPDAAALAPSEPEDAGVPTDDAADEAAEPDAVSDAAVMDDAAPDASPDAGNGNTSGGSGGQSKLAENLVGLAFVVVMVAIAAACFIKGMRNRKRYRKAHHDDSGDGGDGDSGTTGGTPPPPAGGDASADTSGRGSVRSFVTGDPFADSGFPGSADPPAVDDPGGLPDTDRTRPTDPPARDAAASPSLRPKSSKLRLWWRTLKAWWEVKREEWRTGVPYVPLTTPPPPLHPIDVTPPPPAPTGFDGGDADGDPGSLGSLDDPDDT